MATPAAPVDIVNLALLQLYQTPINALTDNNVPARVANALYDQVRRSLLRNFVWAFAKKRFMMPLVLNNGDPLVPLFDFQNYYQLPDDYIKILRIGDRCTRYRREDYDIEGKRVLLNPTSPYYAQANATPADSIPLLYTFDHVNITEWDPLFVDTISLQLALFMCMPITSNVSQAQAIEAKLKQVLAEAQAMSAQENPIEVIDVDYVQAARDLIGWEGANGYDIPVDPSVW